MARSTTLVCQYLENISREAFERYQDVIRDYTRGRQGVYALYRRGKLYYVGLASNLRGRLKHHLRDRHASSWDRFSVYLTVGDSHLRELESLLLRIVRPSGNKQIGKFHRRCENLRRRFAQEIKALHRSELNSVLGIHTRSETDEIRRSCPNEGRTPVLLPYVHGPMKLRARFKGHLVRARVRRDGRIRFSGQIFNSPSVAAAAACKRRSCNGWAFWMYERAPGDWVRLSELR